MTLTALSDGHLEEIWHRIQADKYKYGTGYRHAHRACRIQYRIDNELSQRRIKKWKI